MIYAPHNFPNTNDHIRTPIKANELVSDQHNEHLWS